jgi:hypothetical protein
MRAACIFSTLQHSLINIVRVLPFLESMGLHLTGDVGQLHPWLGRLTALRFYSITLPYHDILYGSILYVIILNGNILYDTVCFEVI